MDAVGAGSVGETIKHAPYWASLLPLMSLPFRRLSYDSEMRAVTSRAATGVLVTAERILSLHLKDFSKRGQPSLVLSCPQIRDAIRYHVFCFGACTAAIHQPVVALA